MRRTIHQTIFGLAFAASAVVLASAPAHALSLIDQSGVRAAIEDGSLIQKTQLYVFGGHRYCFYDDGWHGPGWYRCGYSWREGYGWGGGYGWHGWGGRRFGGRDHHSRGGNRGPRVGNHSGQNFGNRSNGGHRSSGSLRMGGSQSGGGKATMGAGARSAPAGNGGGGGKGKGPVHSGGGSFGK